MSKKKIVDVDALLAYITDWKGNLEKHSTYDGHERVESAIETLNCLMGHIEDEAAYMDEILPQWTNADKEPPKKRFLQCYNRHKRSLSCRRKVCHGKRVDGKSVVDNSG